MKLFCGPTHKERQRAAEEFWLEWRPWFAWYPVRISGGECRWLEYVERRAKRVAVGMFLEHVPFEVEYRVKL